MEESGAWPGPGAGMVPGMSRFIVMSGFWGDGLSWVVDTMAFDFVVPCNSLGWLYIVRF